MRAVVHSVEFVEDGALINYVHPEEQRANGAAMAHQLMVPEVVETADVLDLLVRSAEEALDYGLRLHADAKTADEHLRDLAERDSEAPGPYDNPLER